MRNCFVIILGPTGVGKTDFAEQLGARASFEILNGDLGQFYTPLSIGTAKPDWQKSPIPQHLFDILHEPRHFTVTDFRDHVMSTMHAVWSRNHIPLIVGGSGFYLKSLLFPPVSPCVSGANNPDQLPASFDSKTAWDKLYAIDPVRALAIHQHDAYRIERALDIWKITGKKPSEQQPQYKPAGTFCFVYLKRDKKDLHDRIAKRTELLVQEGWLDEVDRLQNTPWEEFLETKKLIGYADIMHYLKTEPSLEARQELVQSIITKTNQYAKRQTTFAGKLYQDLENTLLQVQDTTSSCVEYNLTTGSIELYINQLLDHLRAKHSFAPLL